MRIVFVSADRGIPVFGDKGASIHLQSMAEALVAEGHELRLLCLQSGTVPDDPRPYQVEQVPAASVAPLPDRLAKERHALRQAEMFEARLKALYRDWPFDMIYERYSLWSAAGCRAGQALGVPVVVEVNAPLVEEQAAYRELVLVEEARRIEAENIARATALAPVSRQLAAYLRARGACPERLHVIGNAVDQSLFHPRVRPAPLPDIPPESFVVGFTGSLKRWHGIDILLRGFRDFRLNFPRAHLLVVGDGPKRTWAQGFTAGAEMEEAVSFTGWTPHHQLPGLLARMDVTTAPYPADDAHYFSPLKLYEYLATGRPVIASRIGQTADLLEGSEAALLVPPGDTAALADALLRVAKDPARAARMGRAAAREGARHDWRENARRVADLGCVAERVA
jgi:glycosyltransferase involved in cell wall biosynthesis